MLINANALAIPLADKSVHTIVTSPPYYVLRDYGVDEQIGLEQTPDEYIANLVAVFRECKRILRDDGTLWVVIGDSYASNGKVGQTDDATQWRKGALENGKRSRGRGAGNGIKTKDLIGIPWMLAFALRADGWYLRQDIIWAKPNPMPESVKDRCTKSHEYIFLLSKSAKYYYDNEAVKEVATGYEGRKDTKYKGGPKDMAGGAHDRWPNSLQTGRTGELHSGYLNPDGSLRVGMKDGVPARNRRDVWTVPTKPYKGAHYATFNPELIKPCILAGAPETCCANCGAPYERIVDIKRGVRDDAGRTHSTEEQRNGKTPVPERGWQSERTTSGYRPTCDCNAGTSSGIVFDPFVGSGTTVATAIQLGRKGIGIDLSFKYLHENAKARVESVELPLLNYIEQ